MARARIRAMDENPYESPKEASYERADSQADLSVEAVGFSLAVIMDLTIILSIAAFVVGK